MELGYRESTESRAAVLRDLRERGLSAPLLAIGVGALGLWAALDQVFPTTEHQRCWNHRVLNVQAKLPKRLQSDACQRIRKISQAEIQAACEGVRDRYVAELRAPGQEPAANMVLRDWEAFVNFYRYPKEHWVHLRTSNPLESIFAGVRLRTDAARRLRRRDNALLSVHQDRATAGRAMASPERRRKPDGPGAGGIHLQGRHPATSGRAPVGDYGSLINGRAGRNFHNI